MTSRIYSIAAAALLISGFAWVEQAPAQSAIPARVAGYEAGPIAAAPLTGVRAKRHYRHFAHYGYYLHTLPYDGYRPYALPIYRCPFLAPNPFYPYCRAW